MEDLWVVSLFEHWSFATAEGIITFLPFAWDDRMKIKIFNVCQLKKIFWTKKWIYCIPVSTIALWDGSVLPSSELQKFTPRANTFLMNSLLNPKHPTEPIESIYAFRGANTDRGWLRATCSQLDVNVWKLGWRWTHKTNLFRIRLCQS